jgi:predicted permease
MIDILNVILPTFIVILIGYLLGKIWKINIGVIVDLVFYVGLPALVFTSMVDKKIVLVDAARVWACSLTIILGCGLAGWVVFKLMRQTHSALYIPIAIMNTVNIPFSHNISGLWCRGTGGRDLILHSEHFAPVFGGGVYHLR